MVRKKEGVSSCSNKEEEGGRRRKKGGRRRKQEGKGGRRRKKEETGGERREKEETGGERREKEEDRGRRRKKEEEESISSCCKRLQEAVRDIRRLQDYHTHHNTHTPQYTPNSKTTQYSTLHYRSLVSRLTDSEGERC